MIDLLSALALVAAAGPTLAAAIGTAPQAATSANVRRKHRRPGSAPIPTPGKFPRVQLSRFELSPAYEDARRAGHAPHGGASVIGGVAFLL